MAYDEALAERVRELVAAHRGVTERRMFGGLAFLFDGAMTVCVSSRGGLLLRVDPAQAEALLDEPHTDRFVMREREMTGWLRVEPAGVVTDDALRRWVGLAVDRVHSLPAR